MNKEILTELGFVEIGNWTFNDNRQLILPNFNGTEKYEVNALYAFTFDNNNGEFEIGYIGKTTKSIGQRFLGYSNPGISQKTNIRIHEKIKEYLMKNYQVSIFLLQDIPHLQWKGYNLNIPAGIEDSLIVGLKPKWNKHGNNNKYKILNTLEEIESEFETLFKSEMNTIDDSKSINCQQTFIVKLGETYLNNPQGFMNPGVVASTYLGDHGETAHLLLPGNVILNSTINRTAVTNQSVRFSWGHNLIDFYRDSNFQLNDQLLFCINGPHQITFMNQLK